MSGPPPRNADCHPERPHLALGKCSQCYYVDYRRLQRPYPPERVRDYNLRSQHGITQADYDAILAAQGGVCAICAQPETKRNRSGRTQPLSVDHNHRTGQLRGLTCHACNHAIGLMDDDPERLEAAATYLRRLALRIVQ